MGGKLVLAGESARLEDGRQRGLYVANADGSGLRQITSGLDQDPHWSPDGRWTAFVHSHGENRAVSIVREDGLGRRVLGETNEDLVSDPWSPDGSRVAWGGCGGLCVFDLRSGRRRSINLGGDDSGFSWSPNGRELVAVDVNDRLVVVTARGTLERVLAGSAEFPAWSPNGRRIAFIDHSRRSYNTLDVVAAAGGQKSVLSADADTTPSWSRDGRRLLYTGSLGSVDARVRVLDVATRHELTLMDSAGVARWAPDGSAIAFTRYRLPSSADQDVWTMRAIGPGVSGADVQPVTTAFPTGVTYDDFDWAAGSIPVTPIHTPPLLALNATDDLTLDDEVDGIYRSGTPGAVVYRSDRICDPNAETGSASFNVWTPPATAILTTSTPCQDFPPDTFAATPDLVAWESQSDLNGNTTIAVARTGTSSDTDLAEWTTGQESPDIGWRAEFSNPISDGSLLLFESYNADGRTQLWQITGAPVPHAAPIPLPTDAIAAIDADVGRILLLTHTGGLVVIAADGTITSRLPFLSHLTDRTKYDLTDLPQGQLRIGGNLIGELIGNTLRVYGTDNGSLLAQLPLAHRAGQPRLLTIGYGYAAYVSGIELHLVRLQDQHDHVLDLSGQAGTLGAILTPTGLFLSYNRAYTTQPGHILFVPTTNLP
jgi:Tol biopolymer transport system component